MRKVGRWISGSEASRQKRNEAELDRFFRLSLDMFCILGFDGRIRRANPAWERTLGYAPEELVGSSSMLLIHPDDVAPTLAQAQSLIQHLEMASFENRFRHKDGSWRWLLWSATAWPAEGAIYALARDVTDRKRAEEENRIARNLAEEASRAKGRFMANVSHEIRTPMNGVVSMAGLLSETALSPRQQSYVKIIQDSAESLLRVINDILDFSKLEQGKLGLDYRVFDVRELVGDVVALLSPAASEKGLRLEWSFAPGTPRLVNADQGRLRQVLVNLVGNAVKFTERGRVDIHVRTDWAPGGEARGGDSPGGGIPGGWRAGDGVSGDGGSGQDLELRFEVEDTGPGFDADAALHLFEPFSQLDNSDTRQHGGTGLGLAISKQLAELMGGGIGFESVVGKGTRFWFTVKASAAMPGETGRDAGKVFQAGAVTGRAKAPPLRILVAEDNPINQMVAVCLLERLGHTADLVANGREALEACKAKAYDVIFMDCQMPELDGYDATAGIRRLDGRGPGRPHIVAMTADALPGSRERCLAAGMDAHLTKPVLIEDIQAALEWDRSTSVPAGAHPATPAPAAEDALDLRIVERLRAASDEVGGGAFVELLEAFLAEAQDKLVVLERVSADGRAEDLARVAHGLKGVSLNFGCPGMAGKCDALQRLGAAGSVRGAEVLIAGLRSEVARAEGQLKGLMARADIGGSGNG